MNEFPLWLTILISLLIALSGIITLVGTLGLVRLRHFYSRMHAPTLGNTLGVFCLLIACALVASFGAKKLLVYPLIITVLLVVTSPVTAILLMRAAIKRETKQRLAEYAPDEPGLMDMPMKTEIKLPPK
ncbi:cation:proton antiporter [Paenalcaligenes hominis]|uniref:Cation:proton antiporter n=1 Tax=Paenalcaligenes hominis TaxID=643674 RepID=A0A1U9JXF2_9BURK|nr:monovalent cation/H(+) antiporter subunit G [Paenalcaligenes hominis]AQS50448.1 cation:proton antiporter [Paenalcaligenes hominis]